MLNSKYRGSTIVTRHSFLQAGSERLC